MSGEQHPVAARLGWRFAQPALLEAALTHASYAHEVRDCGENYQRLEFLGDAALDLLAARLLLEQHPAADEGELSRRRARAVRRETLAWLGARMGLAPHLRLGQSERRPDGRVAARILADAVEAVAGALFLDGGFAALERCLQPELERALAHTEAPEDYKTQLQERCHQSGSPPPDYRLLATAGPAHARRYTCEVWLGARPQGQGEGSSLKQAQQRCAASALQGLQSGGASA